MGFFLKGAEADQVDKQPPKVRKRPLETASNGARGCDNCALKRQWPALLSSCMPTLTVKGADILILGEFPSADADVEGHPIVKEPLKLLQRCFSPRDRDRIAWQNAVRCRPAKTIPDRADVWACSLHLEDDVAQLKPKAILGLGSIPLQHFYPGGVITRMHGMKFPVQIGEHLCWYYPTFHPSELLPDRGPKGENHKYFPSFKADVKRFFDEVDRWPKPHITKFDPATVLFPKTYDEAIELLVRMEGAIALDFETQQLRPYMKNARVLTAGASDGKTTMAWSVEHPDGPTDWGWKVIEAVVETGLWICHSGAMELSWIWHHYGMDWDPTEFEDTMTLGRVQHNRETQLSLGDMSHMHLGTNVKSLSKIDTKRIMDYPLSEVLPYNGLDAEATALLRKHFVGKRDHTALPPTVPYRRNIDRAMSATLSTTYMELTGLPLDADTTARLNDKFSRLRDDAVAVIRNVYEVKEFERTYQTEFNLGNSAHVGTALVQFGKCNLPQTANSKKKQQEGTSEKIRFSTDDEALAPFVDTNPLAKNILVYREYDKLISTYITPFHGDDCRLIMPDGMIHPQYTVLFTATMRLSSNDPNIQNFPKRKNREVRSQIVAPPGYVLLAFDYAQLEARVLAMASLDNKFIDAILNGFDIHSFWRDRMLEYFPDYIEWVAKKSGTDLVDPRDKELLKAARTHIKNDFVFASFYGATTKSCAERLGIPAVVMQDLHGEFWETYRGVNQWIKRQRAIYVDTGQIELMTGIIRSGVLSGNEPINTPIQGTAAHIVLEAQNAIYAEARRRKDPHMCPRINIHDDLTFLVPESDDSIEYYTREIAKELVKPRFDWSIVPLAVEANIGYNWSDLHEIAVIKGDYMR